MMKSFYLTIVAPILVPAVAGGIVSLAIWFVQEFLRERKEKRSLEVIACVSRASVLGITEPGIVEKTQFSAKSVQGSLIRGEANGIIYFENGKWYHLRAWGPHQGRFG